MKKIYFLLAATIFTLFANYTFATMEEVGIQTFTAQSPTLGPVLGAPNSKSRRFWARGPVTWFPEESHKSILALSVRQKGSLVWAETKTSPMFVAFNDNNEKNRLDYTGYIDLDFPAGSYEYRCGFVRVPNQVNDLHITWPDNIAIHPFHVKGDIVKDVSIVLGSCRYFVKFLCFYFWLNSSDETYASMMEQVDNGQSIDAFVTLGDFIYADSLRWVNQARSFRQFMKLYEAAFKTPGFKRLVASVPMFSVLDDHEIKNNFNEIEGIEDTDLYKAGMAAYGTYQHMITPRFNKELKDPRGSYPFMMCGVPALMMDTRSQRSEGQIVPTETMQDLFQWLEYFRDNEFKMIFTGVPIFPAYVGEDSENFDKWFGYQDQLKEMLGYINDNEIHGVIFGSGDIHKSCYSQIQSPSGIIMTNVISSPFYWPYGHDFLHNFRLQIEDPEITEFIPGYTFVTRSAVYPMDGYARVTFNDNNLFTVQLYGKDNEYLNEHDPAGYVLSTKELKKNI